MLDPHNPTAATSYGTPLNQTAFGAALIGVYGFDAAMAAGLELPAGPAGSGLEDGFNGIIPVAVQVGQTLLTAAGFPDVTGDQLYIVDNAGNILINPAGLVLDTGMQIETGGKIPEGFDKGFWYEPTVLSNVTPDMLAYQQEIFGPIAPVFKFETEEEAIAIANDTVYGLSAYVSGGDHERACAVGARLRAGNVHINGAGLDINAPFGGYKQSGNGREFSTWGLEEFLETKSMLGFEPPKMNAEEGSGFIDF